MYTNEKIAGLVFVKLIELGTQRVQEGDKTNIVLPNAEQVASAAMVYADSFIRVLSSKKAESTITPEVVL